MTYHTNTPWTPVPIALERVNAPRTQDVDVLLNFFQTKEILLTQKSLQTQAEEVILCTDVQVGKLKIFVTVWFGRHPTNRTADKR